jgi:hypothetical protein
MGALTGVYLNEYDLTRLGFHLEAGEGARSLPGQQWVAAGAPGRAGRILLDGRPGIQPRLLTLRGTVVADTQAALEANVDALKTRFLANVLELRLPAQPARVLVARTLGFTESPRAPQFSGLSIVLTITLEALDPHWVDRDPVVLYGATAERVRCLLGNQPVAPVLRILGAAVNPVLTYRNAAGDAKATLTITLTLAAGDYLEIDCDAKTITKSVSGTPSNGLSTLTAGDFLTLTPEDGDPIGSAWPTLEVSAGTLQVTYLRRYG